MPAMAAPLAADKLDAWESWVAELGGPRKAAFDDMNARHGLAEHRAYLQPTPDGNFLVLVVYEGPGSDGFLANGPVRPGVRPVVHSHSRRHPRHRHERPDAADGRPQALRAAPPREGRRLSSVPRSGGWFDFARIAEVASPGPKLGVAWARRSLVDTQQTVAV